VPVYQLLGGKFRDWVRRYADIHIEDGRFTGRLLPPERVGETLKGYMNEGFAALKILSVELITMREGNCCGPTDWLDALHALEGEGRKAGLSGDRAESARVNMRLMDINRLAHPFTDLHITEKGLEELESYIAAVRAVIGDQVPLAIDHFGHFPLPDMIKIARRLERFNLAWLEDLLPWYMTDDYAALRRATTSPLATGEDIYLAENFEPLLAAGGVDMVHPDLLTVGGILETKRLGDLAKKHNASLAIHMCESPIASIAATHAAVATENFFALEYDAFDSPWWADIIQGVARHFVTPEQGMNRVSDAPGLGIDAINEEVIRAHGPLHGGAGEIWLSTDEWNNEASLDRLWS
jgi:L-alanine-DL-glutamate epimerase-like enolase superfamily enzyme